jgi:hypothetical protein
MRIRSYFLRYSGHENVHLTFSRNHESGGELVDFPRAGRVGINTDYKPRSTSYR